MDEVDNIIIHSLRQIDCNIEDGIMSLSSFTPQVIVKIVSKCLTLIKPSLIVPESLPVRMAQRFSVTASLAEACKSIGYEGDVGYQTFLYSNTVEMRRVFMFLIERLPKDTEKMPITQSFDKTSSLEIEIGRVINVQLTNLWIPTFYNNWRIRKYDGATVELNDKSTQFQPHLNLIIPKLVRNDQKISSHLCDYWLKRSPSIFQQMNFQTICASIIHKNDIEKYEYGNNYDIKKCFKFLTHNRDLILNTNSSKVPTVFKNDAINKNIPKEINIKQIEKKSNVFESSSDLEQVEIVINNIKHSLKDLTFVKREISTRKLKLQQMQLKNDENLQNLKELHRIEERTFILLKNPEININKMEKVISSTLKKLESLKYQWFEHRKPLIEVLDRYKIKNNRKNSKSDAVLQQVKLAQEASSDIREDLKKKDMLYTQFAMELQKVDKIINRNAYTSRILEIIGNIMKQKNDIDKVLHDTRELQKEIKNISGQLNRQFAVTDDLVYKTAKRDEYSKKSYKLLATLHADCNELVTLVEDTGSIMREIRDIEDQIESEKIRHFAAHLQEITNDLKESEKENKELQEKIRGIENKITII